jgi:hypothetical protein
VACLARRTHGQVSSALVKERRSCREDCEVVGFVLMAEVGTADSVASSVVVAVDVVKTIIWICS